MTASNDGQVFVDDVVTSQESEKMRYCCVIEPARVLGLVGDNMFLRVSLHSSNSGAALSHGTWFAARMLLLFRPP